MIISFFYLWVNTDWIRLFMYAFVNENCQEHLYSSIVEQNRFWVTSWTNKTLKKIIVTYRNIIYNPSKIFRRQNKTRQQKGWRWSHSRIEQHLLLLPVTDTVRKYLAERENWIHFSTNSSITFVLREGPSKLSHRDEL